MGASLIHEGDTIDYTPGSVVLSEDVVVQGDLVGVANLDIPAGKKGSLTVSGVFDFTKESGASTAIAAGANVYWDVAEGVAKTDDESAANKLIGKTILAAGDDDETVRVRLSQ